ncbi:LysM peptidoglycan-binding domain-containing protein [Streptacidiphilus sp. EB129]|uniref:LysM peptidoglycan-binding domain-containing protein n=1 Tax=Streptacidiphilus sp. EB129 TaxID=3156262 RepID=UPI00351832ED
MTIAHDPTTGEKLLSVSNAQAASDPATANQTAADAIKTYIGSQGLDTFSFQVDFDYGSGTVTIFGSVADPQTAAQVMVAAVNVAGVSALNTDALDPQPPATFYTVQYGDNLPKIAAQQYGDPSQSDLIYQANRPMLSSPDKLYPGQVLVIPQQ